MLHRKGRLTKLTQGKQGISDHIRPGLFMNLNTDPLHFQADGWCRYRNGVRRRRLSSPKRDLDDFLFLHNRIRCFRNFTGFFAQSTNMIIECTDRDSVFYTPLAVGKTAGSALSDQLNQWSSFEAVLICFISSNVRFWSNQVQQKR